MCAAITAALPSMSPTVVLIWASATRSVLMPQAYREAAGRDRAAWSPCGTVASGALRACLRRLDLMQPACVVRGRPVAPHAAIQHAPQRWPRGRVDRGQVKMAGDERQREQHEQVVQREDALDEGRTEHGLGEEIDAEHKAAE